MPRGSNVGRKVEKHPLLVSSFISVRVCNTIIPKVFVSVSHCRSSALSMKNLSKFIFFTILSSAGMADNLKVTYSNLAT